jgi:hypothetical protein
MVYKQKRICQLPVMYFVSGMEMAKCFNRIYATPMEHNFERIRKTFSKSLLSKLEKTYAPSSRIDDHFRGNDITMLTNEFGQVMRLYIGKRMPAGNISGEYYIRQVKAKEGDVITLSHWDNKGKVTGK